MPYSDRTDDELIILGLAEAQKLHSRHPQIVLGFTALELLELIGCLQEGLRGNKACADQAAVRVAVDRMMRIFDGSPALAERIRRGWR